MVLRAGSSAARRAIVALLLLTPFVLGSNRCLVGALGYGGSMQCLAVPTAGAEPAASCCHGSNASDEGETQGAPSGSCCIDEVPVPSGSTLDASALSLGAFIVSVAPDGLAPDQAFVDVAPVAGEPPPQRLQGPPPHTRAPPRV